MNVIHISTSDKGGAGIAALRLHQALLQQEIDSKFLCLEMSNAQKNEVYQFKKYYPRFYVRLLDRIGIRISKNYYQQRLLKKHNNQLSMFSFPDTDYDVTAHPLVHEADIIILHWIAGFLDYFSFFKINAKPIIWYLHDLNPVLGGFHCEFDMMENTNLKIADLDTRIKKTKSRILKKQKLHIVGNSKWTEKKAKDYNVFHRASTYTTIQLSVDEKLFFPVVKGAAKASLGVHDNPFLICFGAESYDVKRKGLSPLIKSLRILKENTQIPSIAFICFGGGQTSIIEQVGFPLYNIGYTDNNHLLRIVYSASDVFINPSLDETFGLTTLEAMSCGTPVVGFDVGGIPEVIADDKTGLIANYNDPYDLADKILVLALDKNRRERFAENSRKRVIKKYTSTKQAKDFIKLFSSI